ncbi:MAG: hypothetical protein ACP5NW_02130 [Candidatus Woesearchaeota archaeon]
MGKKQKQSEANDDKPDDKPKKDLLPFDKDYVPDYHMTVMQELEAMSKLSKSDKKDAELDFTDNHLLHDITLLREHLYHFGYPISTNEMRRDFYLKNRLNEVERKNLLDVMHIMKNAALQGLRGKLCYDYSVFAIGSTTYSEEYYGNLEKGLLEAGLTRDDFVTENAIYYYGLQFNEFKTYEEYFDKYTKENLAAPFDEQVRIISRETFEKRKEKEQKSYEIKKRLGDILDNKGEDLDFLICHDGYIGGHENFSSSDYINDKQEEFKSKFIQSLEAKGYKVSHEVSYLAGSEYRDFRGVGGTFERVKDIQDSNTNSRETYRIIPKDGRSLHFYFTNEHATAKVIREKIDNVDFVQLLRRSNFDDFKNAMLNGEKTGIYENPLILKVLGMQK